MSTYLVSTTSPQIAQRLCHIARPLKSQSGYTRDGQRVAVFLLSEKHYIMADALGLPLRLLGAAAMKTQTEMMRDAMNALARAGFDIEDLAAQGYVTPEAARAYDPELDQQAPSASEVAARREQERWNDAALLTAMYGKENPKDEKARFEVEKARWLAQREKVSLLRDLARLSAERQVALAGREVDESLDVPAGAVPPFDALAVKGLARGVGRRRSR